MKPSLVAAGSLGAFAHYLRDESINVLESGIDVVVVPTAAAFTGAAHAALEVASSLEGLDLQLEALMVVDRASAGEAYFAQRIGDASLVVLCDGAALHARSVWRDTLVGEALAHARRLVGVGAAASVLGEVMIDPRGGAPTTGLGLRAGVAFSAPASAEQLARTRTLLGEDTALVVLGPRGVLVADDDAWRVVVGDDVVVTRGSEPTTL
ncbi:MAG: hypothetical protein WAN30_01535 [Acidimicrobiales bacterium]